MKTDFFLSAWLQLALPFSLLQHPLHTKTVYKLPCRNQQAAMFSFALNAMLFDPASWMQLPQRYSIDYAITDAGSGTKVLSKEFEKFEELERFVVAERPKHDFFLIVSYPDEPDLSAIIENRAILRSFLQEEGPAEQQQQEGKRKAEQQQEEEVQPPKRRRVPTKKQPYKPFDERIPEGEAAKHFFISTEFDKLARNFTAVTGNDPFFPPNRTIRFRDVYSSETVERLINQKFSLFILKEFEAHQRARILRGEERSNCFKEGASAYWTKRDLESTEINNVLLPPKGDFYKPALGSN